MAPDDANDSDSREDAQKEYARIKSVKSDKIGFFQRIVRSIRDLDFYGLVFVESGKRAVFYCLKLSLLVGLLTGIVFGLQNWSVIEHISGELQNQIPRTTIENGDVTVDTETPHRMTVLDEHEIILDPEAELNRLRLDPNVLLVVVDGAIYLRNGERSFEAWSLSRYETGENSGPFVLDAGTIESWTPFFQWALLVASCVGLMIGYTVQAFSRVLLISVGGLFARESDSPLFHFQQLLILSCYAITPVILADGLLFATNLSLPYQEFLLLGGGTLFVYFIVKHLTRSLKGVEVVLSGEDPDATAPEETEDDSPF